MTNVGQTPRDAGSPSWRLTAIGIGVPLVMLVLGVLALIETRHDTWQQAERSARNLLLALDRDIGRNVAVLDLSLQGVAEALADPGIDQATVSVRHHALFDRSASAENLGSILVLDTAGRVVEDSTALQPHKLELGDRDYFLIHRDHRNTGLFISRPFYSRLAGGDLRLAISRRLNAPDGSFAGVVMGALRLHYFHQLFEKLELGGQGSITLYRTDGRVLMRYPFSVTDIGRDVSQRPNFRRFVAAPSGQFVGQSSSDGSSRLYSFRRIGGLPLILSVNLAANEIYGPWWHKTLIIGPMLALLCFAAVTSCLLFRREVFRRSRAERALAIAAEKLAVIATTDGLTGLVNRREFDAAYDRAFRRAMRMGTALTVIMFDADFFKRYNDHYGHHAGDEVLRAIAGCMQRNLRRVDDVAARYGGEEFVALLPETEMIFAAKIAEQIRSAVAELAIAHVGSPLGRVTMSVGVATASPFVGDCADELIQAADRALYAAKRDGRNCVRAKTVIDPAGPLRSLASSERESA